LERWEDPSQLAAMVSEAEQVFIHRQSNLRNDLTDDDLAKTYASMCERGDVKKVLRWQTDRDGGSVLSPDDIDSKSGKSVEEVLLEKHPPLRDISPSFLEDYDSVPEFPDIIITDKNVESVAIKLSGSAGLVNFDSIMMRNLLLQHGQASAKLRSSIAKFATWLATENVPWAVHRGLMMCREVALDVIFYDAYLLSVC